MLVAKEAHAAAHLFWITSGFQLRRTLGLDVGDDILSRPPSALLLLALTLSKSFCLLQLVPFSNERIRRVVLGLLQTD